MSTSVKFASSSGSISLCQHQAHQRRLLPSLSFLLSFALAFAFAFAFSFVLLSSSCRLLFFFFFFFFSKKDFILGLVADKTLTNKKKRKRAKKELGTQSEATPPGYEYIEPTLSALERELRDVVTASSAGLG